MKKTLTRAEASNRAFDCPSFCPPPGKLRERWESLGRSRLPATKSPAHALLLSYRPDLGGSLWLLEARAGAGGGPELGARARRDLERATMLVSRELPTLVEVPRERDAWAISRISTGGESVLDGSSFGLSMCLAAAARSLSLPSPPNIAAAAAVDSDGALWEVGGLEAKLRVLYDWALGVDTIIVAATQAGAADDIARRLGASWHIVTVRTVADAVAACFPDLWRELESRWRDQATSARIASDLLRLARDGSNHVLGWRGIAEAASRVAGVLPIDGHARKDARFAELIARRHDGHDAVIPVDIEHLAQMRRPLRLRCLAHIVQSNADSAEGFASELEHVVAEQLSKDPSDDAPDDLRLLGAVGRWHAAFLRYRPAKEALFRAVRGWFDLDLVPDASHALSELLRVTAVASDRDEFARYGHDYAEPFLRDPRSAAVSRGFVLYAVGRGHALLGNFEEAWRALSDGACDWALVPDHLRALRLRWLIKAMRSSTHATAGESTTRELEALVQRAPHLRFVRTLTELDTELEEHRAGGPALRAFARAKPLEYRRFETAYGDDVAARIAREFHY